MNKSYLIVVDAFSKWPEVIPMSSTSLEATIKELRKLFSRYRIPWWLGSQVPHSLLTTPELTFKAPCITTGKNSTQPKDRGKNSQN